MPSIYNKLLGNGKNVFELMIQKKEFLALVFLNLLLQLGITYVIMERTTDIKKYNFWLLIISLFIIIFFLNFPMHPGFKFILFSGFSYIFGIFLSVVKKKHNEEQIQIAIQSALSVFGAMFVVALGLLVGGIKLGYKFGMFLFIALIILIIGRLINYFGHSGYNSILSIFGTIIFSLYVLYDTHRILQKDFSGDFITASLAYYLDVVNLFRNILGMDE